MKKIKLFLCVALFGAMSFGAFSAYDYATMSAEEKAFLKNVEALTWIETIDGKWVECDPGTSRLCVRAHINGSVVDLPGFIRYK